MGSNTGWGILDLAARRKEAPGDLVAKLRMPSREEAVLMELEALADNPKVTGIVQEARALGFSEGCITRAIRKGLQSEIRVYEMLHQERGYLQDRGMQEHLRRGLRTLDKGIEQYTDWLKEPRHPNY